MTRMSVAIITITSCRSCLLIILNVQSFFPVESPLLVTHQFPHLLMHTLSAAVISVIHLLAILGCFHDRLLV